MNLVRSLNESVKRKRLPLRYKLAILASQGDCCFYCDVQFGLLVLYRGKMSKLSPRRDHVLPYSYCFNSSPANMVAACQFCNGIKSDKVFDSVNQAKEYVKDQRNKRGLRVCSMQAVVHTEKEMAEVLQSKMPVDFILADTQDCEGLNVVIPARKCTVCLTLFKLKRIDQRFCGRSCANRAWTQKHPRVLKLLPVND